MSGLTGVTLNAGSGGVTVGVDSDGTYDYQIAKIGVSVAGATPVQVSATNPLPVAGTGTAGTPGTAVMAVQGVASGTAVPVGGTVANNVANGGNPVKMAAVYNSSAPTVTAGAVSDAQCDVNGNIKVNVVNGITSGTAGSPSAAVMSIQGETGMTPVVTQPSVGTGGGASTYNLIAPATPAAVLVQAGAGKVWTIHVGNLNAAPVYVKVFDGAAPTLGTTAASWQLMVPGNTAGAGFVVTYPVGRKVATNLYVAVTNLMPTTDATAIAASTVILDLTYSV